MEYSFQHKKDEQNDRRKSAIITFFIFLSLLLLIYFYKFTKIDTKEQEVVTTMLINFGDNRNGNGAEEPANQEGSQASAITKDVVKDVVPEPAKAIPQPKKPERIITGNNTKTSAPKVEKTVAKTTTKSTKSTKTSTTNTSNTKSTTSKTTASTAKNSSTGQGDGKGNAAIGNLIKGRGTKSGSQGNGGTTGNAGDPLGGSGNGDSKIGVDRRLIAFIPGTMGRGGSQPSHSCSASGTITIAYTVDKAGNVISARRSGGISDPCVSSTSVAWVKKYVKAEKASSSSTGTYRITF